MANIEAREEKALADGWVGGRVEGVEKEGEGGKDRERLFVWLSTLCEKGGGEEKRAGNTSENGFIGRSVRSSGYFTCHVEDSPSHVMHGLSMTVCVCVNLMLLTPEFNLHRRSGKFRISSAQTVIQGFTD